jgi:mRNA-degrading endonuclease YafQ of YafQ-DinJ toxin-antitoxin module
LTPRTALLASLLALGSVTGAATPSSNVFVLREICRERQPDPDRRRKSFAGRAKHAKVRFNRYEKWKDIAALSGPPGLRVIKGFHDESLSGEWKGHRSSRLGLEWRVIYRVAANVLLMQVIQVTPHDYRRPQDERVQASQAARRGFRR